MSTCSRFLADVSQAGSRANVERVVRAVLTVLRRDVRSQLAEVALVERPHDLAVERRLQPQRQPEPGVDRLAPDRVLPGVAGQTAVQAGQPSRSEALAAHLGPLLALRADHQHLRVRPGVDGRAVVAMSSAHTPRVPRMSANPSASVSIDAPIDVVWAVMLDTAAYGEWNPFVYEVECPSPAAVGDPIVLHVRWANGRTTRSPERIRVIEPPHDADGVRSALLSYAYEGLPDKLGLVHSVRHQRLTQAPGEPTSYATDQELTGPMVRFAGPDRITDGFRRHAEGLKQRAEAQTPH